MNDVADHKARKDIARLEAWRDGHDARCTERYELLLKGLEGLYRRWWLMMTSLLAGMGALLVNAFWP